MDTSRQPCKYFQQGSCKYGKECLYSHDPIVNKLSGGGGSGEARPGRAGYRPKYPNMTLGNQFRGGEPEAAPLSNFGQRMVDSGRPFGSGPGEREQSLADRRPGRAGYKPAYKKSTSPVRTRSSTNASSHVNKTVSNNNHNSHNQPPAGGNKKKKGGRKGKGNPSPHHPHDDHFDDRRQSAIQAAASRSGPPQQRHQTQQTQQTQQPQQVTPEQVIQHDLTNVQPQWPFSCYGISTDWSIAGNIIEGVDYSPEELRLQALSEWKNTGSIQQYMSDVQQLRLYVENKRQSVLFNPTAALSEAMSRRVVTGSTGIVLPPQQHQHQHQHTVNLAVNPTMYAAAQVPPPAQPPAAMVMQDDHLGSFHLGAVPLEPPI